MEIVGGELPSRCPGRGELVNAETEKGGNGGREKRVRVEPPCGAGFHSERCRVAGGFRSSGRGGCLWLTRLLCAGWS